MTESSNGKAECYFCGLNAGTEKGTIYVRKFTSNLKWENVPSCETCYFKGDGY